jgi:ABC-type Fe3+-siderophore transport system permease subunit
MERLRRRDHAAAGRRTVIAPVELPVGVITGLVGGIFFLVFLFKSGKESFL